jgi:prepilin-type N-terminal cleavage/methylation domain-containing protein
MSGRLRRASIADERGFTLVEVMVAMLLVATALVALAGSFDVAGKASVGAQRHEQVVAFAQRQLESIRSRPWGQIGMATLPTNQAAGNPAGDPTPQVPRNPSYYVSGSALLIKTNYRNMSSGLVTGTPATGEPFVTGGDVAPSEAFSVGSTTGTVYRYVTWRRECVAATGSCDADASKRITVAVVLDNPARGSGPSKPIWLSTVVGDPNAAPPGVTPPDDDGEDKPAGQPFFLYDTPCNSSSWAPVVGSHDARNTAQTSSTCATTAKPDLMSSNPAAYGTTPPPFANYSVDALRTTPAHGLVLKRATVGCPTSYAVVDAGTAKHQVHSWASPPFAAIFKTPTTDARTAFSFWTQAVNDAPGAATLCFDLRRLRANGTTESLVTRQYTQPAWPTGEPTKLSFSVNHAAFTLLAGERLLLTLSLRADSVNDIVLFYDHPQYESFVTTLTTTPTVELD